MITAAAAYAVLGLPFGVPRSDVKAAYRRLVRRWHPDHNNASAESTRVTQMLNDAREVLLLPDQAAVTRLLEEVLRQERHAREMERIRREGAEACERIRRDAAEARERARRTREEAERELERIRREGAEACERIRRDAAEAKRQREEEAKRRREEAEVERERAKLQREEEAKRKHEKAERERECLRREREEETERRRRERLEREGQRELTPSVLRLPRGAPRGTPRVGQTTAARAAFVESLFQRHREERARVGLARHKHA